MPDLVLLDRDGVINENHPCCISKAEYFHLMAGVAQAISQLNRAQIPVAVVTNQAGVGRGDFSQEELDRIHRKMEDLLKQRNAHIDALYFCTDVTVEPHFRRKPAPGMLQEAIRHFKARPDQTILIGDSLRDLQAAQAAGCQRILVRTGHGMNTEKHSDIESLHPVIIFDHLKDAVDTIIVKRSKH